jgi:Leucine-rich repeat (LRR) protein
MKYAVLLLVFCLTLGCSKEAEPKERSAIAADKNKTDGKEGKPRGQDQPADVVAAWTGAGATHGWYVPNSPGPGDWLYTRKKPDALDALPIFTWESLEAGTLQRLPQPKERFGLALDGVQLTPAVLKEIAGLSNLELLRLSRSTITDEGLKDLRGLTNLRSLFLVNTKVTDLGVNELVALKGLEGLHLSGTAVTDGGMKALARLANLRYLGLNDTAVTDTGLKDLAKLKLQALFLYGTTVTDAAKAELRRAIPNLKIAP